MRKKILSKFFFVIACASATSCAAPRAAWTPLSPLKNQSMSSVQKAEQTLKKVTVATELLQNKSRYVVRIEIRNDSNKTVRGPESIALSDAQGLLQPQLDKEQLRDEIARRAQSDAYLARSSYYYGSFGPSYYYGPRRYRYGRGRSRSVFIGSYYRDDWFERQIEADRILARANKTISTLDAGYLSAQDIPPGATLKGFVQFAKTGSGGLMNLAVKVGRKNFTFEFQ